MFAKLKNHEFLFLHLILHLTSVARLTETFHKEPPEVFRKKDVIRNFTNFLTPATLLKKRLWHRCFPVTFMKFLRTSFRQNTSGRLLLTYVRILTLIWQTIKSSKQDKWSIKWQNIGIIMKLRSWFFSPCEILYLQNKNYAQNCEIKNS